MATIWTALIQNIFITAESSVVNIIWFFHLLREPVRYRDYHNCTDMETEAQRD